MSSTRSIVVATSAFSLTVAMCAAAIAQQAAPAGKVVVESPWARATPGGAKVGGAFMQLSAPQGAADKLVGARTPIAGTVELHTHSSEGGVMRMRRIDGIPLEAGAKVKLAPGGLHLMLMDLKQPLKAGESVDMTLVFEKAGEVEVKVPVLPVGSPGPKGSAAGHGGHGKH
ncbi:MAG: copper chaperone PCu(A)C [Hyphomicrobiaceae bacterium]